MSRQSRFLSYMLCDLVDSTGLIGRYDSETAFDLIEQFRALCRAHIAIQGGVVVGSMGDGILACFGYPTALESHAEAACRCALGVLDGLRGLPQPLELRVGIACGRGVLELRRGGDDAAVAAVSSAANLAARLQAEAAPDQIMVSEQIHGQLAGLFAFGPERQAALRGFDGLHSFYPLLGPGSFRSRSHQRSEAQPAELVGRDGEMAEALAGWRQTVAQRRGGSLLVRGPAGIGKTALLRALRQRIGAQAQTVVLYSAWPAKHRALHPFRIAVEDLLAGQPPQYLEQWLAGFVEAGELDEDCELLSILIGRRDNTRWAPKVLRERTLDCLSRLLLRLGAVRPTLVVVEDAHWLDPSSVEVLERLQARYAGVPVFVLGSSRPAARAGDPPPRWPRTLELAPLREHDAVRLISELDPELRLGAAVRQEIALKAQGVPLLVREFTKATLAPPAGDLSLAVPDTLLDSFTAQIDAWAGHKDLLDLASAVGGSFDARLMALALRREEDEVAPVLRGMAGSGLLASYRSAERERFDFSHALLRDAAYAALLPKQRRDIHARALQARNTIDPQFAQSQPSLAAHHLAGIGDAAGAIRTLLAGGQACFGRSQFSEADGLLRQALKLLPQAQPGAALELQLQTLLGLTLTQQRGFGDAAVNQAFSRAWEICAALDHRGEAEFQALWGIWAHKLVISETGTAVELVDSLAGIGRRSGQAELSMLAHAAAAVMHFVTGRFGEVQPHVDAVRRGYVLSRHRHLALAFSNDPLAQALMFQAHSLALRGESAAAERCRHEVLQFADELGLEFLQPYVRIWSSGAFLYYGATEEIVEILDQSIAQASRLGIPFWVISGLLWKAHAYTHLGRLEAAIPMFQEALDGAARMGIHLSSNYSRSQLAWVLARTGQPQAALPVFGQCLRRNLESGELCHQAEIHRLHGEALLHADRDARDAALQQFIHGLRLARAQGAGGWERKILQSLAQFEFDQALTEELAAAK